MITDSAVAGPPGTRNGRLVLALACACQFMVILDASIVNVALPAVDRDLGFAGTGLTWVVDGYLLAFAGLMLPGGRAADLFGPRRMLTTGLLLFAGASLAGGLAATPAVLVTARIAQGAGAALLAPAILVVINTRFPAGHARARAFGAWSAAGGVGGLAGASTGGLLTSGLSWRWVFLINVPIGAALIALALTALAGTAVRREPLDLIGALCGTAGLAALIHGVMSAAGHGWTARPVAGPIAAGLLLLGLFVVVEARVATRPVLPLRLLRIRGVAVGAVLLLLFGTVAIAMWYFTALFLQDVLGYRPLAAGLSQTPAALAFPLVARQAAGLLPRLGSRAMVLAGCGLFLAGFGWLSRAGTGTGYLAGALGPTLLIAAGIGLVFPALMATATTGVPDGDTGIAGGIAATAQQAGAAIGLAALATAAGSAAPSAYHRVFLIAAGVSVVIALVSLLLPGRRRARAAR
ncbi:MFS transporter [Actinoplanes oblitus]|uniref:MFS transporter n=1 Tax=Actinoplanes oblitus TaxID=3040509 RepID=A0ABY8W6H2_9ACTN|nr:MFS transporter [Actinoplanes oblitus]WIM93415.1 MFS transporter [Actinoplanes oblitus]